MAYKGQTILIPLGFSGLISDLPQSRMSPGSLIEAKNVSLYNGYCEKSPGSRIWNRTNQNGPTTVGPIQAIAEYFPAPKSQRILVLSKDGTVSKFHDRFNKVVLQREDNPGEALKVRKTGHITPAGGEMVGTEKKAFIFSGGDQVQVIHGDEDTFSEISDPSPDWTDSYPTFGLIYRSRLWCFGNSSAPDFLYASEEGNQENFVIPSNVLVTSPKLFDVFAGEGSGISAAFVFKSKLFVCKNPTGLYVLNDDDPNPDQWYFTRVNSDFGVASSHSIVQIFDDTFAFNAQGTITSVSAAFQFGDIESADVFTKLKVERYFREALSGRGLEETHSLYYPDKKQVFFTFRSKSGQKQDRILVMDLSAGQPQMTVLDKDEPNCLASIQDLSGISRPVYGSDDGNIYELDCANTWVQETDSYNYKTGQSPQLTAYEFVAQTPHMDFSFADPALGMKTKKFDFLEIAFQPTGNWNVLVDVYIDSEFVETIQFNLNRDLPLADVEYAKSVNNNQTGYGTILTNPGKFFDEVVLTNKSNLGFSIIGIQNQWSPSSPSQTLVVTNRTGSQVDVINLDPSVNPDDQISNPSGTPIQNQDRVTFTYKFTGTKRWLMGTPQDAFLKDGFTLDEDRLDGDFPKAVRKPLHGQGRTISFKLRSDGLSQNIKIQSLMVYFRSSDERQIKDPRG